MSQDTKLTTQRTNTKERLKAKQKKKHQSSHAKKKFKTAKPTKYLYEEKTQVNIYTVINNM